MNNPHLPHPGETWYWCPVPDADITLSPTYPVEIITVTSHYAVVRFSYGLQIVQLSSLKTQLPPPTSFWQRLRAAVRLLRSN